MIRVFFIGILFFFCGNAFGQIFFQNPSFEDTPKPNSPPSFWATCEENSTPDILPGPWGVKKKASEGDTYIGLIVRNDGTKESIIHYLKDTLKAQQCYSFKMDLSKDINYAGHNRPIRIKVYGMMDECETGDLLAYSPMIAHMDWRTYKFDMFTKKDYQYILIKAEYVGNKRYNGNILIDNLTIITRCIRA